MTNNVIIACDFPGREATFAFLETLGEERPYLKIGMELFNACGPDIVRDLKARGYRVFLDLKLHDIPNTVRRTCHVLGALGADIVNVHAAGGSAMMAAAREGLLAGAAEAGFATGEQPKLIAVTQLTSTSQEMLKGELLIERPMAEVVASYAKTAAAAGLDGVVCSALEAAGVHEACGAGFLTVCPGIRLADAAADDQTRVMTPAAARVAGADYIVVGRPITKADDPAAAYRLIKAQFEGDAQ